MYSEIFKAIVELFSKGKKIPAIIAFILLCGLIALLAFGCTNSLYVNKGSGNTISPETTLSADSANVNTDIEIPLNR